MTNKKKATIKELQLLCGYLNFLAKAIVPGRTFIRKMYSKFANFIEIQPHKSNLTLRKIQPKLKTPSYQT